MKMRVFLSPRRKAGRLRLSVKPEITAWRAALPGVAAAMLCTRPTGPPSKRNCLYLGTGEGQGHDGAKPSRFRHGRLEILRAARLSTAPAQS